MIVIPSNVTYLLFLMIKVSQELIHSTLSHTHITSSFKIAWSGFFSKIIQAEVISSLALLSSMIFPIMVVQCALIIIG